MSGEVKNEIASLVGTAITGKRMTTTISRRRRFDDDCYAIFARDTFWRQKRLRLVSPPLAPDVLRTERD